MERFIKKRISTCAHDFQFADNCYDPYLTLSSSLGHQDAFNEIVFISLQHLLASKGVQGAIGLNIENGDKFKYGSLLNDPVFKSAYPNLQDLRKVHRSVKPIA